jgi:hypothetical protein
MAVNARPRKSRATADALSGEQDIRDKFWSTAKKAARQVPFMEELVAAPTTSRC